MIIRHILEKGTARINEDTLVIQDNLFGVFDGATSLDRKVFEGGKTGGKIASDTARSVFSRNHYPLKQLASEANREIMNRMIHSGVDISSKENLWNTSAAVVRVKGGKLEWVQSGDAVIILIYEDGSHKVLTEREDHDFETLTMWKQMVQGRVNGLYPDRPPLKIGQALAGQLRKVRSGMNLNYGVLNGEKAAETFLNRGEESLNRVTDILLFTDGLSIPQETPQKRKAFGQIVEDYLEFGLEELKNRIRREEEKDPFCLLYPRFKCHDDIAAIAIETGGEFRR